MERNDTAHGSTHTSCAAIRRFITTEHRYASWHVSRVVFPDTVSTCAMRVQVHVSTGLTAVSLLPPPSVYTYIISFKMAAIPLGLAIGVAAVVGAAAGAGFHAFKRVSTDRHRRSHETLEQPLFVFSHTGRLRSSHRSQNP